MHGSRTLPIQPGYHAAGDLSAVPPLWLHDTSAWDGVDDCWLELEHQHQGGSGTATAELQVRRASDGQVVADLVLNSTTAWQRYRVSFKELPLVENGTEYEFTMVQVTTGAGAGFVRVRNVQMRYEVAAGGGGPVQPFALGQEVGDGQPLSLFPLWDMRAYPADDAEAPRWPSVLPTTDRWWVGMSGSGHQLARSTWDSVQFASLWRWDPQHQGGGVSMVLEVPGRIASGYPGTGDDPPVYQVGLFYADDDSLVRGSLVTITTTENTRWRSGSFLPEPNRDMVARVRTAEGAGVSLEYVAVRLEVTVTGDTDAPLVRVGASEELAHRRRSVTGTTWEPVGQVRPYLHGGVDHATYLEASLLNAGSGGDAEVRLVNRATATSLATLTESGGTLVRARSADLRATLEGDGVVLDEPGVRRDWDADVDARGSTATDEADLRAARLLHTARQDPVSDLLSVGASWALDLASQDADLSAKWTLDTELDLDLATAWEVLADYDADLSAGWVLDLSDKDLDLASTWSLQGAAASDLDAASAWSVQAPLNAQVPSGWAVAAPRDLDPASTWRLRAESEADLSAGWEVARQVDVQAGWVLGTTTATDLDHSAAWLARYAADADLPAAWATAYAGGLDVAGTWTLDVVADADLPAAWSVLPSGASDLDAASDWSVVGQHDLGLSSTWDVAVPRDLDAGAAWRVAAALELDRSAGWVVSRPASDLDVAATWGTLAVHDRDTTASWSVLPPGATVVDVAGGWNVSRGTQADLPAAWSVFGQRDADADAEWALFREGDADLAATWVVAPVAHATVDSHVPVQSTLDTEVATEVTLDSHVTYPLDLDSPLG